MKDFKWISFEICVDADDNIVTCRPLLGELRKGIGVLKGCYGELVNGSVHSVIPQERVLRLLVPIKGMRE